jgi:hypothetical protein
MHTDIAQEALMIVKVRSCIRIFIQREYNFQTQFLVKIHVPCMIL